MTVKQLSKFKKLKYEIITTLQWIDFVPLGEISQDKYKQHLFVTNKTMFCVFLDGNYFGIDLFQINEDEQNFNGWGYKLQLQKNFGILVNVNSIGDKYQIGVYSKKRFISNE